MHAPRSLHHIARHTALASCLLLTSGLALAQQYPSKPIRFVVPVGPGVVNDVWTRYLADKITKRDGWTIIVENKVGGNFIIAARYVLDQPADGHTVLQANSSYAILPNSTKDLPFDVARDFAPIGRWANAPLFLLINPGVPAKNMAELVAYSKANPGKLSYGTTAPGGASHLLGERIKLVTGLDMTAVPYKDSTALVGDLLTGRIPMSVGAVSTWSREVTSGKVRGIAIMGAERVAAIPNVPTIAEQGFPMIDQPSWQGFWFRSGTPADLVNRMNREVNAVMEQPEVREYFLSQGNVPTTDTPEAFRKKVLEDIAVIGDVIRRAGVKFE